MKARDRETPSSASPGPANLAGKARDWVWLTPLILCPALLIGCWAAPFSLHDDIRGIRDNRLLSAEVSWTECFAPHADLYFYYPLTLLSWRLDRFAGAPALSFLAGEHAWPASIRTGNLVLHVIAALFLWLIARRLGASPPLAAFVTAGFALHPTACESVCWAIERKTVLACALGFMAIWQYMRAKNAAGHALGLLAYGGALLAKPSALGVFPILVVWELLRRPRLQPAETRLQSEHVPHGPGALRRLCVWALPTAAGTWIGWAHHAPNVFPPPGGSLFTALLTNVVILSKYALNFLGPHALSAYYAIEPVTSPADGRLWLAALFLGALVGGTLWLAGSAGRRTCLFGWLWVLGALGPHLNLVSVGDLMHDRYAYLAAPGLWLAVGLAARSLPRRLVFLRSHATRHAGAGLAMVALLWSAISFQRSHLFADTVGLFTDAVRKETKASWPHFFLAGDLERLAEAAEARGDETSARSYRLQRYMHLKAATAAVDRNRCIHLPRANAELAVMCYGRGEWEGARAAADAALHAPPGMRIPYEVLATSNQVLGLLALRERDCDGALARFDEALKFAADRADLELHRAKALVGMARKHGQNGETKAAVRRLSEARACLRKVPRKHAAYAEAQALLKRIRHNGATGTTAE
jgi:hypothetical protein